jgi:hypothetical protein
MIVGIANIYLYTGLTPTGGNDSALAEKWLRDNNIEFTHLWYGEPSQHASVFEALNTWNVGQFNDFPFVIYDERHDDFTIVKQTLIGLDAITNSNLVELAAL